jgi:hypothetical protein
MPEYTVAPYVTVKGSARGSVSRGPRGSRHLRPRNYSALLGCGTAPITVFRESYGWDLTSGSIQRKPWPMYASFLIPNRFFNIIARGPRLNPSYLLTCDWISAKCQGQSENRLEVGWRIPKVQRSASSNYSTLESSPLVRN